MNQGKGSPLIVLVKQTTRLTVSQGETGCARQPAGIPYAPAWGFGYIKASLRAAWRAGKMGGAGGSVPSEGFKGRVRCRGGAVGGL